ncbi:MAG TPA: flagellar hook-length control protein FliK [Negativicutes bacterium]|nr:flagellar hook-length control protein FliK [Negativicutes bacterium]
MDVTMMPFIAETAQPVQAQKPAGKTDSLTGEESGGFAEVFAGLVSETPGGGGEKKTAADDASGDTPGTSPGMMPGMVPGMWSFVPLMPTAMNAGQAQTAAEGTSAIAPLTAAGMQATTQLDAARGQSLPGAQTAPPIMADADLVTQLSQKNQQNPLPTAAEPVLSTVTADRPQTQPTTPAVQTSQAPATPAFPVTAAVEAATTAATAPQTAVAEANAAATLPVVNTTPQLAVAVTEAAPTVLTTAVKSQVAPADQRTEKMPQAEAGSPNQAAAPATPVPTTDEQAAAGDNDANLTAADFAPATPKQATAADTTTPSTVFAAMVDQRIAPPAAETASAANPAQQPANPDPNNVAGQIVDHARLITRAENSEMVIKLKPEHLGELTLKIAVENGTVSATFHTASAEVRSAIEASLPQLRQDMASQGLKVDYVGVQTSLDHFFANDQRHAPQQQQLNTARRQSDDEVYTEAVAAAAALSGTQTASGGIDYRV